MSKLNSFGAAASLVLAAAAFAQPASFTDLGDHSLANSNGTVPVTLTAANNVQWFKIVLPATTTTQGFVDLWTNGPGNITDTLMGLYDNAGTLKASDDDDGPGNGSALSFGKTTPTRAGTAFVAPFASNGTAYNGRDGVTAVGVHWIAVMRYTSGYTFNAAWSVTTPYAGTERTTTLGYNIEVPSAPTAPTGVAAANPAFGYPGSSFVTTCTVTPGANPPTTNHTVSCDASAVGGGTVTMLDNGVPPDAVAGDLIFTGTVNVSGATTQGSKTLTYNINDAQSRPGSTTGTFNVRPANDDCANAVAAFVGANAFNLNGAQDDAGVSASCQTNSHKDTWYTFVPPTTGSYQFDTIGCGFDSVLSAYNGCGGTQIGCDDDTGGSLTSKMTIADLPGGVPVTIRVAAYNTAVGSGNLNITGLTPTAPTGVGAQNPANPVAGSNVLLTVTVTPGAFPATTNHTVSVNLSAMTGGSSSQTFYDDGSNGDVTPGDNVFSYTFSIAGSQGDGTYACPFSIGDAEGRPGSGSMNVVVVGAPQWDEAAHGDAGDLPGTAQAPTGSGPLNNIGGSLGTGDAADMYKIQICDFANFSASTNHPSTNSNDTQLFLFNSAGVGVQMDDDNPTGGGLTSTMHNEFVTANGIYYIAVSHYDNDPQNAAAEEIWADQPFAAVRAPDGLNVTDFAVASWNNANTTAFGYRLVLTGTCFAPSCTADFNGDTVVDFFDYLDFVDAFSANAPAADFNHDDVIDFFDYLDFVDAFAAGCP